MLLVVAMRRSGDLAWGLRFGGDLSSGLAHLCDIRCFWFTFFVFSSLGCFAVFLAPLE